MKHLFKYLGRSITLIVLLLLLLVSTLILWAFEMYHFADGVREDAKHRQMRVVNQVQNLSNEWTKLKNNEKIDCYFRWNGSIYCGEVQFNEYPMENADTTTFEVFPESQYARDKNHVYYPLSMICVDGSGWGVCFCDEYIVQGADPLTFKYLGNDYGADKSYGYYRGVRIQGSDRGSFEIIKGPKYFHFATDKNNVYVREVVFKEADPSTFRYDKDNPLNDTILDRYIVKDTNAAWEFTYHDQFKKIE